ncbi:MAG: phenylacetate-CoA oxygenase/reductase subunit PaaK [Gammaproteobacteria bacterium]|nr:phenylacetate-CoA oxygenase/reductase subunit PaaK [Gammaproteobacteria bacterium]
MAVAGFHRLTVAEVERETDDAVCVRFEVPTALRDTFAFRQGQYLTLRQTINGEDVRRSYSICSGVDDDALRVAIKHIEGGRFSAYANAELKVGDSLEVMPPEGRFTTELKADNDHNYLCIAAGSGITPILSIVKSILSREPRSHVTLLYGNQRVASIMFRDELERLKNRYMDRFQLIHVLSKENREVDILNGRIDNRKGAALCRNLLDLKAVDDFFLCGPEGMISEVSRGLRGAGVDEARIHYELFGASAADAQTVIERHHERARRYAGRVSRVTVKADGRETHFDLSPDGENILDAALEAGVDLPYACKGGACATCKCRVVKGEVEMDVRHALEDSEIAAGYVLSCQAHPVSDEVLLDFDQAV